MILLDTGPLVALCDARDALHRRAVGDLQQLSRESFATCDAVLAEVCFHLPHAAQRLRLRALLDRLAVAQLPESAAATHRSEVFDWILKYAEHEPDWADGCLAVFCVQHRARIWTYDAEFRTTWRLPGGGAIPLV